MTKFLKLFGVAALVGLSAPAKATAAVTEVFNWSGCGGQNFASCATVIANFDDVTNVLSFSVQNTNTTVGWPGRFTAVGFAGMGTPTGLSAPANWNFDASDASLSAGGPTFWAYAKPNPPGISPPNTLNFSVQFGGAVNFSNITFGLREQGLDNWDFGVYCAGSNRLHVNKQGDDYTETIDREGNADCYDFPDDPPVSAVPEPATMVLLATGLLGLAGAQLRRRKNTKV